MEGPVLDYVRIFVHGQDKEILQDKEIWRDMEAQHHQHYII